MCMVGGLYSLFLFFLRVLLLERLLGFLIKKSIVSTLRFFFIHGQYTYAACCVESHTLCI